MAIFAVKCSDLYEDGVNLLYHTVIVVGKGLNLGGLIVTKGSFYPNLFLGVSGHRP